MSLDILKGHSDPSLSKREHHIAHTSYFTLLAEQLPLHQQHHEDSVPSVSLNEYLQQLADHGIVIPIALKKYGDEISQTLAKEQLDHTSPIPDHSALDDVLHHGFAADLRSHIDMIKSLTSETTKNQIPLPLKDALLKRKVLAAQRNDPHGRKP